SQNNYDKAWEALNKNKWNEATQLLKQAQQDPATFKDAYISNLYLQMYNGKEKEVKDFKSAFFSKADNPYPYVYALWFNSPVAGSYGKKYGDHQLEMLTQLIKDDKAPSTLQAAANYQMGMHYLFSNDFDKALQYSASIGNVRNWQYTGPFENLSKTGIYKNYGPLENAGPDASFKSLTNAEVKWFTPAAEIKDGWTPVSYQFNKMTAVVYAQNFINSATDQTVYCCVGASGSLKVWVNDELVLAESVERVTELDTYIAKCELKKGTNRILIQLGYTDNSYANFSVRFLDERMKLAPGISGSANYAAYPKKAGAATPKAAELPFAEKYFVDKIAASPDNLVNYLLLADVYLRNHKVIEARNLVTDALKKAPDNCLLRMKMAEVLIKEENRTLLLEEIEVIKQLDPNSLLVMDLNIKEHFNAQKYEDAEQELKKRIMAYGEDESMAYYKLMLLIQDKKYEELVKEVEKMYEKYPNNERVLEMTYAIKKDVYKDNKGAIKVYENFLKKNYDYSVLEKYADILAEQGEDKKVLEIKKRLTDNFPYSPNEFYNLSKYYFSAKQYDKAEESINKSLAIAPYNEYYWENYGDIQSEKKNVSGALDAYNKSLKYDPNQYDIINKIRKLNGKEEIYKLLPQIDITATIKADDIKQAKNTDYGYYYILDQKDVVLYPGGASEEYYTNLIRITNEKGVDRYKESSIGYGNHQALLIEKAEVIKKNQSRIDGEKNGNEIVFTNLEAGDVVVFKYRLRSYGYGRMAKEYWDRFYFGGQIYTATGKYNLFAPADRKIYHVVNNGTQQPVIKDVDNFKQYSWTTLKAEPDKDEPLMPQLCDVSPTLHISTIPSWKEVADWYSDISSNKAEEDFEIVALYKKLFPAGQKPMTQFQKARVIYDYIESNIRYSSVPFRQSAYVPQRPSLTLSTRLGDCKDLSSLFVTLANMAGINAQMVLINTRDNGQEEIKLPGVEFNHCIVKAVMDNKKYYIELTDNYLPFSSLPNNIIGAAILEVAYKNNPGDKADLLLLPGENRTKDAIKRVMDIKPVGSDLEVSIKTVKSGNLSSSVRSDYLNLDNDKQMKDMESTVASSFKNNVKLSSLQFKQLEGLADSVEYSYAYKVKNEIAEIGAMKTFKITYPDIVASLDRFSADTRTYPIEYWTYENTDSYETIATITAPAGTKFIELPASESLGFKDMKFSITYTLKAPDKLVVTRKFTCNRQNIAASDYAEFKAFFEKIVKAEQKFIAYK
ncbi:MAG TPA: transglutaminase domain-containing protein, partial [Chitinophagaceae bacterium]